MVLWRHFSTQGFESLESVHKIVSSAIKDYGQNCLICGSQLKAKVFRATICHQSSCNTQFSRADYEVRLADLRWEPSVMDLLLLGVFASARANRLEFLHPCPLRDQGTILQTMAGLPDIYTLQGSQDLYKSIKGLGQDAEALMLWMASYRGFLASATGLLKIPNLPGVHQFVLTSTTPELETSYNFHLPTLQTPTQVVFHGTTMDRLFPILQRGLQVGTGTTLLQNGASYGSGIYVATDISMAFGYAGLAHGYGWPNTRLGNTKVVFACELVGNQYQNGGIYVVPDPTQLRIRYVFLFPSTAYPPVTHHIVPAIQSAFSLLRLGLV
jgi:Poly(ADP-ribose) polymerase catalytic domain